MKAVTIRNGVTVQVQDVDDEDLSFLLERSIQLTAKKDERPEPDFQYFKRLGVV